MLKHCRGPTLEALGSRKHQQREQLMSMKILLIDETCKYHLSTNIIILPFGSLLICIKPVSISFKQCIFVSPDLFPEILFFAYVDVVSF